MTLKEIINRSFLAIIFLFSFIIVSETVTVDFFNINLSFVILFLITSIGFLLRHVYFKEKIEIYELLIGTTIIISIVMSIAKGNSLKDIERVIFAGLLLVLPRSLSYFIKFSYTNTIEAYKYLFFVSFSIFILWANFGFLKNWNSNSMAYLLYFGIGSVVICILNGKNNLIYWISCIFSVFSMLSTGGRGVLLSLLILIMLVVLKKFFCKKMIYRITYISCLLYPMIMTEIPKYIKSKINLYESLLEISYKYFNKTQLFSGRDVLFEQGKNIINSSEIGFLIGYGKTMDKFFPAHNTYLIIMYLYGILGTLAILGMYIVYFEKAYVNIKRGDKITYGCVCILLGMFIQLATESYFIGISSITLMPFVYFAIILVRNNYFEREK